MKTFHFQSQVLPIAICKLLHVSNLSRGNPIIKNEETHTGDFTRVLNDFGEECFITRIKKIDGNIKDCESLFQIILTIILQAINKDFIFITLQGLVY